MKCVRILAIIVPAILINDTLGASPLLFTITGQVGAVTQSAGSTTFVQTGQTFTVSFVIPDMPPDVGPNSAVFHGTPITLEFSNGAGPRTVSGSVQFPESTLYNMSMILTPGWSGVGGEVLDLIFGGSPLFSGPLAAPDFTPGTYTLTDPAVTPFSINYNAGGGNFVQALYSGNPKLVVADVPVPEPSTAVTAAASVLGMAVLRRRLRR